MSRSVLCLRCQRLRPHQARGLCNSCYVTLCKRGDGALDEFELTHHHHHDESFYCDCDVFVPEAIPLFSAVQCAICKRPARSRVPS